MICPVDREASRQWRDVFWKSPPGLSLTHLISTERVGPSLHDDPDTASCRNIRGISIDESSADLYRLIEDHPQHVRTIGIGDGGNEIGMGTYWSDNSLINPPPQNACRTRTDWTILAGVSDWGAMALAAAYAIQRDDISPLSSWPASRIEHGLSQMVAHGPAIDGCTHQAAPTVDSLPFSTYIQPWELIQQELKSKR